MDLFITVCIVANTAVMAMDQHGLSPSMMKSLEDANRVNLSNSIKLSFGSQLINFLKNNI